MQEFVNRERELDFLRERYDSPNPELLVVYGRRRLGKSELVRRSLAGREDAVYFQATETTPAVQLDSFVEVAAETYPAVTDVRRDWEPILGYLGKQDAIVVVDEFPHLIVADDSVPSVFQRAWDVRLQETAMTLVLVGSSISIMEEKVLAGGSPLHGRRTGSIDLEPLAAIDARAFYPGYDPATAVRAWSVFGGTPYYLQAVDPGASLESNVSTEILSPMGRLHDEPEFLLRTELERPNTYFSVLRAMAMGRRQSNEIAGAAGVESNAVNSYLSRLVRLRIVERDVPVTEDPTRSRQGRYRLRDPLFRFWFRFVHGNEDRIRMLGDDAYDRLVAPEIDDHAAQSFERLCADALPDLLPREYLGIGRWWYHEHELDVVGLCADGVLVLGECKFTGQPVGERVLWELEETGENVRWTPPGGGEASPEYVLFGRSGFTEGVRETAADRPDVSLFTVADVLDAGRQDSSPPGSQLGT